MCLARDFHAARIVGHAGPETPHVRMFEMGSPRALRKPIADLSQERRQRSRDLQKLLSSFREI